MVKVAVMSIGYPNFRFDIAQEILDKSIDFFKDIKDIELIIKDKVLIEEEDILKELEDLASTLPDVLVLELGTYSYGSILMKYLELFPKTHLLLWSFREPILPGESSLPLNSLCALNMFTSFLHRLKHDDFSYIYGNQEELQVQKKLSRIIQAIQLKHSLRKAKFAIIGGRVPGFYLSNVDELKFRSVVGPELVYYSLASLLADAKALPMKDVDKYGKIIANSVAQLDSSKEHLERSARLLLALEQYAEKEKIDGFALKCWPELQSLYNMAPCGVVGILNDRGLPTACEGDVTGLVSIYLLGKLSRSTPFLTDLVNITEEGRLKLWHCGAAAPSIAASGDSTYLGEHPTMKNGIGLGGSFDLKEGEITICKLSEDEEYKMLLLEATAVKPDRQLTGNQIDAVLSQDTKQLLERIVSEGIEHHYAIGYNVDTEVLKEYCRIAGIRPVVLE